MLFVPLGYCILYITGLYGLAYSANYIYNKFINNSIKKQLSYYLNENIHDSYVYKTVNNLCIRNNINTNSKILVCCTGNEKSMALLACLSKIFKPQNISVLLINHFVDYDVQSFIHDFCIFSEFKFYNFDYNFNYNFETNLFNYMNDIKLFRRNKIVDICKKEDISHVFEAHTIENNTNSILHNLFSGKNTNLYEDSVHYPFLSLTNNIINHFVEEYSIPFDYEYNKYYRTIKSKHYLNAFEDFENLVKYYYPDWRFNLVKEYNMSKNSTNIDNIINTQCYSGKFGFIYYYNRNLISDSFYNTIVEKLCSQYNKDELFLYSKTTNYTCYLTNEFKELYENFNKSIEDVDPKLFLNTIFNNDNNTDSATDADSVSASDSQSDSESHSDNESGNESGNESDDDSESVKESGDDSATDSTDESESVSSEKESASEKDIVEENDSAVASESVSEDNSSESSESIESRESSDSSHHESSVDEESSTESSDSIESTESTKSTESTDSNDSQSPIISVNLVNNTYKIVSTFKVDFIKDLTNGIIYFRIIDNKFNFYYNK
jgi:tRNA(Ile)-lysidine synthase TilS/MesJ